jgi:hypothetical protein
MDILRKSTAAARLAGYRETAARYAKGPTSHYFTGRTWRDYRYKKMHASVDYGITKEGEIYTHGEVDQLPGYRSDCKAHEIVSLRHTGWFSDIHQDTLIHGVVAVLRLGENVHVCEGYQESNSGYSCFDLKGATRLFAYEAYDENGEETEALTEIIRTAAFCADRMAEREAENQRDADAIYQAEQKCEELKEEIDRTRAQVRTLIKEIRQHGASFSGAICETLRSSIRQSLHKVSKKRERIAKLTSEPWIIAH